MGIINGGEKISISPTWSEHAQHKVDKPRGRHKGSSVYSIENTVPQNGKGKKLPIKSLFSRSVSNSDKAAAKEKKATEKKAVKAFMVALDDVKKAVNNKNGSSESVQKVINKHAKNQGELEDLLANLTRKSGQAALQPHVQKAFKEAGLSMMLSKARNSAQPLKNATDHGQSFRDALDKCMAPLRAQRQELSYSTYPDSIRDQLKSYPALTECLVEELPNSKGYSSPGNRYSAIQAQTILTCQCFEQAHQIKQNLNRTMKSQQLPPETKSKIASALNEVQGILEATQKDLKSLHRNYAMKGEGHFLNTEYRESIKERIHSDPVSKDSFSSKQTSSKRQPVSQTIPAQENRVQPEAKAAPKPPGRAAPAIPFDASLAALKKERPELTREAGLLRDYLKELQTFCNSRELVNLLGKDFSAHRDAGWSFDEYASLCQQAAGILADTPSLTTVEVMDAAYKNMGTPRQ
ncbi:hypothetical protein [Endozoicomonas sp. 8E]|uniref:hypothetical protein n=1 Tax=Endozoicomonas sp. 8E TaxID=3035692 RepID=UPI002938E127|nr:hypothetical protein [Endozoicomonas sp. 8E]WOG26679.1 hypothetical protein P6910_19325 [Endozoicomonas sp. 8E]